MKDIWQWSREIKYLENIQALLHWDMETHLPKNGFAYRGEQNKYLANIIYKMWIDPALLQTVENASTSKDNNTKSLARVMKKNITKLTKLDADFVAREAVLSTEGMEKWLEARERNDFGIFAPTLKKIFDLNIEKAKRLEPTKNPYDVLIEEFAPGFDTIVIDREFNNLARELPKIIARSKYKNKKQSIDISEETQEKLSRILLQKIGYDFDSGGLSRVRHPFMTSVGAMDQRVTNRYLHNDINSLFSAIHEGGHALYEQGIDTQFKDNHLSSDLSLAIHESQSRFWENIVGKSNEAWQHFYSEIGNHFGGIVFENLHSHILSTSAGLIRVDADEISYDLHIIIRYQIEKAVINGELKVEDISDIWNQKYREYLGIEPKNLKEGALQDVHWSMGAIGYFPSYTLGNIYASQIWDKFTKQNQDWGTDFQTGNFADLRNWLRDNIHRHGSSFEPKKLMDELVGKLNSEAYIERLKSRYN